MSWIKKNGISGNEPPHPFATPTNPTLADLDLELYKGTVSSSNLVSRSYTTSTNTELLQYTIPSGGSGTYTVRVVNNSYNDGLGNQYISLAWY